jgi:plasmid rolling circle replication initiator protein Rep
MINFVHDPTLEQYYFANLSFGISHAPNSLIFLNKLHLLIHAHRKYASKAFYCIKKLLLSRICTRICKIWSQRIYSLLKKRAAQSAVHLQKGALKAIHMNRNLRAAQSIAHLQKGVLKAIHMNRNLRAAQSAAHLQKGALKVIHMNRNLRAAQSAAHLQKGALKVIHMT